MRDKGSSGTHTYRNIQYMFLFNLPIFQAPHEAVTEHHPIAKQSSERSLYQGGSSHGCSAPPSALAAPPCTAMQHKVPTHKIGRINTTLALPQEFK